MARELILLALVLLICGPTLHVSGILLRPHATLEGSGRALERACWRRIWTPLVPAFLSFAALLGWAFQEPKTADESLYPRAVIAILPVAAIWLRALVRAVYSEVFLPADVPAMTRGLLRPRVFVSRSLAEALDPSALRAAYEHEAAHVRNRDPLRIWIAQLATDLQWPLSAPRARFSAWRHALELARDEEARGRGAVEGVDLAAAVLTALRLRGGLHKAVTSACLTGDDGAALEARIARLLEPLAELEPEHGRSLSPPLFVASVFALTVLLGALFGEVAVRALPGVASCPSS